MHYQPDIGFHGSIKTEIEINDLVKEPSLTLCDLQNFGYWGGAVSHKIFREITKISAFKRIITRTHVDPEVSIRISTYTVWLDAGQVPSSRQDWHIDRVGTLHQIGVDEIVDLRDPFQFPSFMLVTAFIPEKKLDSDSLNQTSTEFLLSTISGSLPAFGIDNSKMHQEIDEALKLVDELDTVYSGNRMIVSFSPRTIHRPGKAIFPGWRYMLRIGLYTTKEKCSPYADHFINFNPVWDSFSNSVKFRKVGRKETYATPNKRSIDLLKDMKNANDLVRELGLFTGSTEGVNMIQKLI